MHRVRHYCYQCMEIVPLAPGAWDDTTYTVGVAHVSSGLPCLTAQRRKYTVEEQARNLEQLLDSLDDDCISDEEARRILTELGWRVDW